MRIRRAELECGNVQAARDFYGGLLGFAHEDAGDGALLVRAGWTELVFTPGEPGRRPVHHVAFNVPANMIEQAAAWLGARAELLPVEDDGYLAEFRSWEARGVYAFDPCGNVIEFIGRRRLPPGIERAFTSGDVVCVSEVGVVVTDVQRATAEMTAQLGLAIFGAGGLERFCPLGDDEGLLIVVEEGRVWFPTADEEARASATYVEIESGRAGQWTAEPYAVHSDEG